MTGLPLQERDRRYARLRSMMALEKIDCLVVWGDSGKWDWKSANLRYLTQIGGNGEDGLAVFPRLGPVPVYLWSDGDGAIVEEWKESQDWVTDIRGGRPKWSQNVANSICEMGLEKGVIGITGMAEVSRAQMPYGILNGLFTALPNAQFVEATHLLEKVRLVKSSVELQLLEEAAKIGAQAIETVETRARVGMTENEIIGMMMNEMIACGSDLPVMFLWDLGRPIRATRLPYSKRRPCGHGDVAVTEFSPKIGGYTSQFSQPLWFGRPPSIFHELMAACEESYASALSLAKPGVSVGELYEAFDKPIRERGFFWDSPHFHGLGLGNENPSIKSRLNRSAAEIRLESGMVFAFEPGARSAKEKVGLHIGDPVAITDTGARSLSPRKLRVVQIQ